MYTDLDLKSINYSHLVNAVLEVTNYSYQQQVTAMLQDF